jgi:hypothetical protein
VDVILKDAENILSTSIETVGSRHAGRIWAFLSKFVMVDRLGTTLGLAKVKEGIPIPRKICSREYLGTCSKVSTFLTHFPTFHNHSQILDELSPPTKVLNKFLKTWGERDATRSEYLQKSATVSVVGQDPAGVTMLLSKRLIAVVKAKNIIHIEAGLEMMALALAICSEVSNIRMFKAL